MKIYSFLILSLLITIACKSEDVKNPTEASVESELPAEAVPETEEPKTIETLPAKEKSVIKDISEAEMKSVESSKETAKSIKTKKYNAIQEKTPANTPSTVKEKSNAPISVEVENTLEHVKPESVKPPKPPEKINEIEFEENDPENPANLKDKPAVVAIDHSAFDALLKKYVSNQGVVDYKGFKSELSKLDAYLDYLDTAKPADSAPRAERLAYWINAYNAFTIKLILNNYPVQRITDLHGGKPWDHKWINLGGKTYSLNNIENDIIRPVFQEPRIHFAVNCAAKSCPPLAPQAFTASNLEGLLEKRTKQFVNNSKYNQLANGSITISKIFEWYAKDFMNVASFVSKYSDTKIGTAPSISYNEYDWTLNGK